MAQLLKELVELLLLVMWMKMIKGEEWNQIMSILPGQKFSGVVSGRFQAAKFVSAIECAAQMLKTKHCFAAMHCANDQSCFTSDNPADLIIHSTETDTECRIIYTKKISDEWKYVFGAKSGTNKRLYEAYETSQYTCSDAHCVDLYKNEIVNNWNTSNIEKAMVVLFDENKVAAWLEFNTNGTNKSNWFNEMGLSYSSWIDVVTSDHNQFVQHSPALRPFRAFYISHQWGGCPNDLLWILVSEVYEGYPAPCPWEGHGNYPQFQYSVSDKMSGGKDLAFADWFSVFIKKGQEVDLEN